MKTALRIRRSWRQPRAFGRVACGLLLAWQIWPVSASTGQVPSASQPAQTYGRPRMGNEPAEAPDPLAGVNGHKLDKMREDERRKRLLADTAKLVALTSELQAQVEKASKDELSLDVVRKAAEIEKLARDVKDRMKG